MPFGAPDTISHRQCRVHEVEAPTPQINGKEVSHSEYLEHMNGRVKLDVLRVRGEHQVGMRRTVPAEWCLV